MPETSRPSTGLPGQRHTGGHGSHSPRSSRTQQGDPLRALSAASGDYNRDYDPAGTPGSAPPYRRQRVTFLFPTLGAIVVGFVLLIAGRNVHLCGATFRLPETLDTAQRDLCRNTLYDVVSADMALSTVSPGNQKFFVDFPAPNTLRFAFATPKSDEVVEQAKRASDAFLTSIKNEFRRVREEPSEGEQATSDHIAELKSSLTNEQRVLDQAIADVPEQDHRAERDGLLDRWRSVRERYRVSGARVMEVAGSVEQLRNAPPPSHGIVTSDQRREAYGQDLGLQQDLKELAVSLTEIRGHIGRLQADTAALHTHLDEATAKLTELLKGVEHGKLATTTRDTVEQLSDSTDAFHDSLASFSTKWEQELTAIRESPIKPRSQELLDRYQRTRSALSAFLFDASKLLARMRDSARTIDTIKSDNGRVLQLQASVSRSFQTLQTFYHRFEFAASQIDRSQNFRLDAALRSARGLRRRSRLRMQQIDEKLQRAALIEMKSFRATSLRQAEALLEFTRGENDATVSALVDLQDQLSERVGSVEAFVAAVARAEMGTRNVASLRATLAEAKTRLQQLESLRKSRGANVNIELATTGILGPPINVGERFRNSAIGAAITLIGLLMGQWWVARRT
jgi:hypothetical protein